MTKRVILDKNKKPKHQCPSLEVNGFHFVTEPMAHQLEAFSRSKDLPAFGFFMEQGTGKSKVVVDTICYLFLSGQIDGVLIIAPNDMYHQWAGHEGTEWDIHGHSKVKARTKVYVWNGGSSQKAEQERSRIIIADRDKLHVAVINIEGMNRIKQRNTRRKANTRGVDFADKFVRGHRCMVVVDESDTIKNLNSRTRKVINLGKMGAYRRILTGTPITNSPMDLYFQFYFLDPKILGESFTAFRSRYAVLVDQYVSKTKKIKVIKEYQRLKELKNKIDKYVYRVTKDKALDLPKKIYSKRIVEMGKEQERIYNDIRRRSIAELEGEEYVTTQLVLTKMLRLKQVLCGFVQPDESDKVYPIKDGQRLKSLMSYLERVDGKIIIWCCFRFNADQIEETLQKKFGRKSTIKYVGGTTKESRQEMQKNFNDIAHPSRFFIATGGRRGLNLYVSHQALYFSNDFSYVKRIQSEDRIHRKGQTKPCSYVDFYTPGTVEDRIFEVLRSSLELSAQITGDNWKEWI